MQDAVDRIIEQWARERPDLDTIAMEVFGRIYRIARRTGDRLEKIYGEHGISRTELDVLATLRRAGKPYRLNPGALTTTMMLTTGGMTGCLDRLERREVVRRLPDPTDRRALLVELTGRGRSLIDRALPDGLADQQAQLAAFDRAQLRHLANYLRLLLLQLEEDE